jgi:hypothetical protein
MKYNLIDPYLQIFSGTLTAILAAAIIPESWNMFFGMISGGMMGMFFMIILMIPLTAIFGGFEVMIPLFLVTMTCGMVGGMMGSYGNISLYSVALTGAIIALIIYGYVAWSDHKLKGLVSNEN